MLPSAPTPVRRARLSLLKVILSWASRYCSEHSLDTQERFFGSNFLTANIKSIEQILLLDSSINKIQSQASFQEYISGSLRASSRYIFFSMKGLLFGALALGDPTIDSIHVYPAYNFSVPVDRFHNESRSVKEPHPLSFFLFPFFFFAFMLSSIFTESVRGYPHIPGRFCWAVLDLFGSNKSIRRHDQNKTLM